MTWCPSVVSAATPDHVDLARRLVARPGWEWLPGLWVRPILADGAIEDRLGVVVGRIAAMPIAWWPDLQATRSHDPRPGAHLCVDLEHDANAGILLGILERAMPLRIVLVCLEQDGTWNVETWQGATLAEAAARALLGLQGRTTG